MGLDFQRASAQEVAEHDLAVRMNPVLRNLPGDAEGRRSEIEQVLEAQPRLIVDRQYGDLREMLQQFEIVDAEGNPCNGGVHLPEADSVVECFSTDKLKLGVTQHFRCPTLLLVPNTRFLSLVQAIDNHRISGQNDTLLLDSFREEDGRSDTIEGWRPMIVDGARGALAQERLGAGHTKPIDYVRSKWKQRMQVSEDLCGIDRHAYAMLIMISMKDA